MSSNDSETRFLAGYDPQSWPPTAVTVDVVALTIRDAALHVLLIRRANHPYKGHWALPGGFIRDDEDLPGAAARVLTGKTGQPPAQAHLEQLATYGTAGRDPRMRVVSVAYLAFAPGLPDPEPGFETTGAEWVPVASLGLDRGRGPQHPAAARRLAFDHTVILGDGVERARSKLEYTPLATAFAGEQFTIPQLLAVYEAVWGLQLHPGNFRRKIMSTPGFVEPTGTTTLTGGSSGGPRARLYRAGPARSLYPPLTRPSPDEETAGDH
jgi:8-oxo-dGTP diphosphatase